ncbi:uncharacterized protein LOC142175140 [Nicotiana tabacum]|uniref:Uncharacterized protein LOC142175140 n=1 Tax=Nicotiana tabacum TaxID=4097 RepID=A0AC58TKR7_TOBAC
MYASSAQVEWEDLTERFNKVDGSTTFNLHKEIATLSQGTTSILVYFSKLKDLWEEFEALVPAPGCDCPKSREFVAYLYKLKLYQFLMGLNDSYSQARSQLLMRCPTPTANQAYVVIVSDEGQKSVAATSGILGANPTVQMGSYEAAMYSKTGGPQNFNQRFRRNAYLLCEVCKMKRHNKENCYKVVGYPKDFKNKMKGNGDSNTSAVYNANVLTEKCNTRHKSGNRESQQESTFNYGNNASTEVSTNSMNNDNPMSQLANYALTKNQYEQILQLLNKIASIDSAFSANVVGATNHMVSDINLLKENTITETKNSKKILLPNGDVTVVSHIGFNSILEDSLITNELFTRKVKGIGKEDGGLYLLCTDSREKEKLKALTTRSNETIEVGNIDIDLRHRRLGHVSTQVLKRLAQADLETIKDRINKCIVCPCAKQTRLPFPTSSIQSKDYFDLIHIDLWGPYKVPTWDENRYFLTIVDDYSRMTWIFLKI